MSVSAAPRAAARAALDSLTLELEKAPLPTQPKGKEMRKKDKAPAMGGEKKTTNAEPEPRPPLECPPGLPETCLVLVANSLRFQDDLEMLAHPDMNDKPPPAPAPPTAGVVPPVFLVRAEVQERIGTGKDGVEETVASVEVLVAFLHS